MPLADIPVTTPSRGQRQQTCLRCGLVFYSFQSTARYCTGKCYRKDWIRSPKRKKWEKNYGDAIRLEILAHYGPNCKCCGETKREFLGIDHINGGGTKHRQEVGTGRAFYAWLKRKKFPAGYQTLCHNCNLSLGFYGYCPHQKETNAQQAA